MTDWRIRTLRTPRRRDMLLASALEYLCVATGHWNACHLLNGGIHPGRWHRFVNRTFEAASPIGPWRPFPDPTTSTAA